MIGGLVMRKRLLASTVLVATLLTSVVAVAGTAAAGRDDDRYDGHHGHNWHRAPLIKVGAASRSVLPTVNGSHDYLDAVEPDPLDPFSPGLFVPAWDQGASPSATATPIRTGCTTTWR